MISDFPPVTPNQSDMPNPYLPAYWDIYAQQRLRRKNPTEAKRLQAEARAERLAQADANAAATAAKAADESASGYPGYNPWDAKTLNHTEQAKLTTKNPTLAKELCERAGAVWRPPHGYYDK